jgi:hypothetical protein
MTKVLLLEPLKRVWDLIGDCVAPPLGLAHLAAMLEREPGVEVDILDANARGWRWPIGERWAAGCSSCVSSRGRSRRF